MRFKVLSENLGLEIMSNICILLATFNGEKFVAEQVLSIQNQTVQDWVLLVRDDGSSDNTCRILADIAAKDSRIMVLERAGESAASASQNFGRLMEAGLATDSQIFFFCDQDDTWDPTKLWQQVQEFPEHGAEAQPLLVHSDLAVVDKNLGLISSSLMAHMALEPEPERAINALLTRNYVTGCATACNRRLVERAAPLPQQAIMHDWWVALIAASSGSIIFIALPLVNYRQHSSNAVGAAGFWHLLRPTRNLVTAWFTGNDEFVATFIQANALLIRSGEGDQWPADTVSFIAQYTELSQQKWYKKICVARNMKLREGNNLLKLTYYLRLLIIRAR